MLGITVTTYNSKSVFDVSTGLISISETVSVYQISEDSLADGLLKADDIFVSAEINALKNISLAKPVKLCYNRSKKAKRRTAHDTNCRMRRRKDNARQNIGIHQRLCKART